MLLVPVLVLLFYAFSAIAEKRETTSQMNDLLELAHLAKKISNLVHETQKERGMSAAFIGSQGDKFASELPEQRELTDKMRGEFASFLKEFDRDKFGKIFNAQLDDALGRLSQINGKRKEITALTVGLKGAIGYYTGMNASFLDIIGGMGKISTDGEVAVSYLSYYFLQSEKERGGIERAVLSGAFAADAFAPGMHKKFVELVVVQGTFKNLYLSSASPEEQKFYRKIMTGDVIEETERMRNVAFEMAATGGFGIDAAYWFKMQTKKLNLMREVVGLATEAMLELTNDRKDKANAALAFYILITIGALGGSVVIAAIILRNIIGAIAVVVEGMKKLAGNDLTHSLDESRKDEMGELAKWFNSSVASLREVIGKVSSATSHVSSSSEELSANARQSTKGVDDQRSRTDAIASAMEELSATITAVSTSLNEIAEISKSAMTTAEHGGEVVSSAIDEMTNVNTSVKKSASAIESLGESSKQIGEVINVINDIADQTNLLALNAAIEAARAGEHGRGFAVVADEVRKLAERTTRATKEIGTTIEDIQQKTGEAVSSMNVGTEEVSKGLEQIDEAGDALKNILLMVKKLDDRVNEVAVAGEEQATTTSEISDNTTSVSDVAKEMSRGAEQITQSADDLSQLASDLTDIVNQFKI
jgi:methyl-accepting chemotaxis protein